MSIYQAPDLSNTVVLTTGYSLPNLSETTILVGQYVNYTRPSYNTADVTWQNVRAYTRPEYTTVDASWVIEKELQGNISVQNFISSIGEIEHYTCNKPWETYSSPESNSVNFDFRCATELTVIPENNVNFTWADIRVYSSGNINLLVSAQGELLHVNSLCELVGEISLNVNTNSFILHKIALSGNLLFNLFSNGAAYLKGNGDVVQVVNVNNLSNKANVINPEIFDVYPKFNEFGLNTINYIKVGELTELKLKNFNFYNLDILTKDIVDIFYESGFASGSSFNCNCQTGTKTILRNKSLGSVYNVDGSWYSEYIPDTFTLKLEDNNLINVPKKDTLVIVSEDYTEWNVERRLLVKFKIPNFCKYFYNFLKLDGFNEPEYISNIYEAILDFCEPLIYFTSGPYPIHTDYDNLNVSAIMLNGTLRDLVYNYSVESLNVSANMLNGTLRDIVQYYSILPECIAGENTIWDPPYTGVSFNPGDLINSERINVSAVMLNGTLRDTVKYYYTQDNEFINISASMLNGSLIDIVIYYSNWIQDIENESINVSAQMLNGTLV